MNKYLIVVGIIILVVFLFYRIKSFAISEPSLVKDKIQAGALVVDVRTPQEFSSGHYPGALNIPVDQVEKRIAEFGDKTKPIVVYCASGGRSASAKNFLDSYGFLDVTNAGGFSNMPK